MELDDAGVKRSMDLWVVVFLVFLGFFCFVLFLFVCFGFFTFPLLPPTPASIKIAANYRNTYSSQLVANTDNTSE